MAEKLPRNEESNELSGTEIEKISGMLSEVTSLLNSWYETRNSKVVSVKRQRVLDYRTACDQLKALHKAAEKQGRHILLTVGSVELATVKLSEKPDDLPQRLGDSLKPFSKKLLPRIESLPNFGYSDVNLYLGEGSTVVAASTIAQALSTDGLLEVVETE